jgi:ankyrin repeat protein
MFYISLFWILFSSYSFASDNFTLLQTAVKNNDINTARLYVKKIIFSRYFPDSTCRIDRSHGELCHVRDSLVHEVCKQGHLSFLKLFISHNVFNAHCVNRFGYSPLHLACRYGHISLVKYLISSGALIDARSYHGQNPLFEAVSAGYADIVSYLLSRGASLSSPGHVTGETLLYSACLSGDVDIVRLLLSYGADAYINFPNYYGWTPLFVASRRGYADICRLLLDYNALVNVYDRKGKNPMYYAYGCKRYDIYDYLRRRFK